MQTSWQRSHGMALERMAEAAVRDSAQCGSGSRERAASTLLTGVLSLLYQPMTPFIELFSSHSG